MWQKWKGLRKLWRMMCNIFQHDQSDGEAVIVWGGISMEEPTDFYRLGHSTLTAIRHWDKILGPAIRPGAVGPGFHLIHGKHYVLVRPVPPRLHLRLSTSQWYAGQSLVGDPPGSLIRSLPWCCQLCIQAHGGHTNYWATFWVAVMKFGWNGLACSIIFFHLDS